MRRLAALVIGSLLVSGGTALAQDKGDFTGGYRFIRSEGVNFGKGWYVDVTRHVTDMVSIVGDVGGSYKSESETEPITGATISADIKIHSFAGGLKVRASTVSPNLVPFGQALFGVANSRGEISASVFGVLISDSVTDPLLNLSGGVDVSGMALPVGLRVQVGYVRIFSEGEGLNAFQISVGAKIGF